MNERRKALRAASEGIELLNYALKDGCNTIPTNIIIAAVGFIKSLLSPTYSVNEIADKFGVSSQTIRNDMCELGIKTKPVAEPKTKYISFDDFMKIKEHREKM